MNECSEKIRLSHCKVDHHKCMTVVIISYCTLNVFSSFVSKLYKLLIDDNYIYKDICTL